MSWKQFFAKKSLDVLLKEMAGEHRLRRVLGPITLSSLGIGAIIGTGIFVLTGVAARQYAGPALILSFVVAGLACAFAALCYAEFASMAPIAGSAYTYAYVSLGEMIAWIIGWDLVLEYAMSSATVANGWAHYFLNFLGMFRDKAGQALFVIPAFLATDPFTAADQHADYRTARTLVVAEATALPARGADGQRIPLPVPAEAGIERVVDVKVTFTPDSLDAVRRLHAGLSEKRIQASIDRVQGAMQSQLQYEPSLPPARKLEAFSKEDGPFHHGYEAYENTPLVLGGVRITFNIVSIAIVALITAILVIGIRESAGVNAVMVLVKVGVVLFVIVAGIGYIDAKHWQPFMPYGWTGVLGGAAVIFFAYIGFDAVSTHAEEARNPATDVPIGIISSLAICTVLYIVVAAVVTGMLPYPQIPLNAPIAGAFEHYGAQGARVIISIGALTGITSVLLVMLLSQPRVLLAMSRDGLLPYSVFGAVHPRFRTPHKATILTGIVCGVTASFFPLETLGHMVNIGTLFAFVVVCAAVWLMRRLNPDAPRPFRTPCLNLVAPGGILLYLGLMVYLGWLNWVRLGIWLAVGLAIYLFYGRRHSHLGKELRGEITQHGVSPAGVPVDGSVDGPAAPPPAE
jgi:APA family basic amino acid/polyamine antiporter